MNAHPTPTSTDRGFKHMPPISADLGRNKVEVYESSAASAPHIWLAVASEPDHPATCIHLTVDTARLLAEQLLFLADNHYQVVDR